MTVTRVYVDEALRDVAELRYDTDKLFIDGFVLCTDATIEGTTRLGESYELACWTWDSPTEFQKRTGGS
jgi:Ca2+-transporting ATPase